MSSTPRAVPIAPGRATPSRRSVGCAAA